MSSQTPTSTPTPTTETGVLAFLSKHDALAALLSVLVIIPCVWHRHIEAGDLGSHTYNAWLAQLVEQGKAPGVYIVTQWKNVLFDLILFYLAKLFGLAIAEKMAVSLCVLIFFWGVFAFVAAVTRRPPWFLSPVIAMLVYGYVFYMGFMNYYLSIGLASFAMALMWPGTKLGFLKAAFIAPLILLAHPLGFLWFLATASYRLLWLKLEGWPRLILPVSALAFALGVHIFFVHHPQYQADWEPVPFFTRNGFDQFVVYSNRFRILSYILLSFALACSLVDAWKNGLNTAYWKERRPVLELYFCAVCVTALVPQNFKPDPNAGWVGVIVTRLTIISAIVAVCWLASLQPRAWHLAGYGALAIVFFVFMYQTTAYLNRLEENVEKITRQLPFGTRVLLSIFPPAYYRTVFLHLADRACVGYCFVYSNYEPSTREFRVRVREGSPVVTASPDDSENMQSGTYQIQEEDLPLKEIYQCEQWDLTHVCIRDLAAGEENGRLLPWRVH